MKVFFLGLLLLAATPAHAVVFNLTGDLVVGGSEIPRYETLPEVDVADFDLTPTVPTVLAKFQFNDGLALRLEDSDPGGENINLEFRIVNNSSESVFLQFYIAFLDQQGDIIPSIGLRPFGPVLERPAGQQALGVSTSTQLREDTPLTVYGYAYQIELVGGPSLTIDRLDGMRVSRVDESTAIIPEPSALLLIAVSFLGFARKRSR